MGTAILSPNLNIGNCLGLDVRVITAGSPVPIRMLNSVGAILPEARMSAQVSYKP